jgi:hypothetical protein
VGTLDEAFASLAADLEANAGETVVYTRSLDGAVVVLAAAVRGRNTPQRQAMADGRVNFEEEPQDWLVRAAALDYGPGPFEPARGDRLQDGQGRVYELAPRDGEPAWRPSDPYGVILRLRTVRVG